jgi:hypothetical protein
MRHKFFSRKFWMTVFAAATIYLVYNQSVGQLHDFNDPEHITAFTAINRDMMVAMSAIVLGYLGINGVVQWRHGTGAMIQQAAESIKEDRIFRCAKLDPKDLDNLDD